MVESAENRSGQRLSRSDPVKMDIVSSDDTQIEGQSFRGVTLDISRDGLLVRMEKALPVMTVVEICAALKGVPMKFFLKGRVVHSSAAEADGWFYHGIKFDDKPTADLMSWEALFET